MIVLWLLIGFIVFWAAIAVFVAFSTTLCPQCGQDLRRIGYAPWQTADWCGCGWRKPL